MALATRKARQAGTLSQAEQARIKTKSKFIKVKLDTDEWHDITVRIRNTTMTVNIDGKFIGQLTSDGIGHPTKQRIRLAVNASAWIDFIQAVKEN
jgi:hypothetical protein